MTENSLPKFPQSFVNLVFSHYKKEKRNFSNGFHCLEANFVIFFPQIRREKSTMEN
jgi:hypothetical protein